MFPVPRQIVLAFSGCLSAIVFWGCSAPPTDGSTAASKKAIFETVDLALTRGDCATAVIAITPLLNSANSDNDVRLKAASAYGCDASINFFPLVTNLAAKGPAALAGPGLWSTMAEFFPSSVGHDYVVEGAELGLDALQATLIPGALVLPAYQVNPGSYNVGSIFASDRTADANIYSTFVSMAGIGGIENRYGAPDASYIKTVDLPWTTATSMTSGSDGAAYVAFILSMIDGMGATVDSVSSLQGTFSSIVTSFQSALDQACAIGCTGVVPPAGVAPNDAGNWQSSGCNLGVSACTSCPVELRDRSKTTGQVTDEVSCAAAGIVNLINNSALLGWN